MLNWQPWESTVMYQRVNQYGGLTCIFWVADGERTLLDLLLKQILFIQEQDDGGVCEPLIVADAVKQLHALMHSVLQKEILVDGP